MAKAKDYGAPPFRSGREYGDERIPEGLTRAELTEFVINVDTALDEIGLVWMPDQDAIYEIKPGESYCGTDIDFDDEWEEILRNAFLQIGE